MIKRHAAEIDASSGGAKEQEIKDLIRAYEVKLRASQGTEFVNLQVELTRKITEVQTKTRPSIEDVKERHQREKQEHLSFYSQLTEAPVKSSPDSPPYSLTLKEPPPNQPVIRPAKRPLADVRDWTTSLELDGWKVRWMLRAAWESLETKRQRLDDTSHAIHKPKSVATIKMLRYDQVRSNAMNDGHWDTIVEWPSSSGQFWVIFCAQHNMHFKMHALIAGAKHVNGSLHGTLNKEYSTALIEIGYYIPDCNKERARSHNAEVQEKLDNGYKPCNRLEAKMKAKRLALSDRASHIPPKPKASARTKCHSIIKPKPFHVYYCYFEKQYWACLILGWDKQMDGCPYKTLEETRLFRKKAQPPECYLHTSKKILGWEEGYEDGGPKIDLREFPIMYFDGKNHVGWAPAMDLTKMDLMAAPKGEEYPESSYNEARQWIATTAGYDTWEEYRTSGVNIRKPTPAAMSEGQSPSLHPTNMPSDHSVSDFDEIFEGLRARGGDDSDDEDYQDDGRSFKGGRPSRYVTDYEDDEWTAKYCTRQEGMSSAISLAAQSGKIAGSNQKSGPGCGSKAMRRSRKETKSDPGKTQRHLTPPSTLPPTNSLTNGIQDRSSEPCPNPRIGSPSSESVASEGPIASTTARRTKSMGAGPESGFSEAGCRLPDLRALVTGNLSKDRTRDIMSQPREASGGSETKTATSDNKPTASPITSITDHSNMSAGPTNADSWQRRASGSSRTTTMTTTTTGEAVTATPTQSLITSRISAAPTPMMVSASSTTGTDARPKTSGPPKVFEITKYADATRSWERADREEACVKLCSSEDDNTVTTSDERISIAIDPQRCMKPQVQTIEGREGMSLMTLPQVSGEVVTMVFDRSRGSKIELGKIQARNFVRWLQAQNPRLR